MIIPARGAERGVLMSWPRPYPANPYLTRLAGALAHRGVTTRAERYLVQQCAEPRGASWLHVHWPEWMLRDRSRLRGRGRAAWFDGWIALARARGVRLAWTAHNLFGHDDPHPDLARANRRRWLAQCDVVFGHFPSAERDVRDLGFRGRFALTPHPQCGDDYPEPPLRASARASLGYRDEHFVILAFGAIEPYKGFDRLAAAFRAHAPPHARLLVAGRPADEEAFAALRRAAAGDSRIRVDATFVSNERVPEFFTAADAVACTYRSFYTSGTAMLALSFGAPIIGPAIHHLATFQGEPFFVECADPDRLGDVWPRLAALGESDREAARAFARTQTWDRVGDTVVQTLFGAGTSR